MAKDEKLLRKEREAAVKLKPRPVELPSGSWRCQVMVGGKRISIVADTPKEAHAQAVAAKAGIIEKMDAEAQSRAGAITLANAIDDYITARRNTLSPSTVNGYYEIKRNRFPSLMSMHVRDIQRKDIQIAVNEDAQCVGAKTIRNALTLVSSVIAEYNEIDIKKIKLPQKKKQEHAYLQEDGLIALFDAIRGCSAEVPILLAVWLGLRRSEIMGLCWDCVDFDRQLLRIERTYVKDTKSGYVLREEMKTSASRRVLVCPGYILSKIDAYQPNHSLRNGRIFRMHPNTPYEVLKDVCARNGIEFVGLHGLRHTNASVMLSLGVMDKYVMAQGGWSTDHTMKRVYQHLFQSGQDSATKKRDSFFGDISTGRNPGK